MPILDKDGKLDERLQIALDQCDPAREEIARALSNVAYQRRLAHARRESALLDISRCGFITAYHDVCNRYRLRNDAGDDYLTDTCGCSTHPQGRPWWPTPDERLELLETESNGLSKKRLPEDRRFEDAKKRLTNEKICTFNDCGRGCRYKCVQGTDFCWNHGGNQILLDMALVLAQKEANTAVIEKTEVPEPIKRKTKKVTGLVEDYLTDPDLLNVRTQVAQAKAVLTVCMDEFTEAVENGEFNEKLVQLVTGVIDTTAKQIERLENIESKKVLTAAHVLRLQSDLKHLISIVAEPDRPKVIQWIETSMFGEMQALPAEAVSAVAPSYLNDPETVA